MADDERPDERDKQVAQWLQVEPLDDVTRRRLVSTALREGGASDADGAAGSRRSPHALQWLTAAAVLVVVLVVGLALLTAGGGTDDDQANRNEDAVLAPKAAEAARDVGDYGDLDDAGNLAALRSALETPTTESRQSAPQAASDTAGSQFGAGASASSGTADELRLCGVTAPDGGSVVAQGTGTLDGRRATVVLVEDADGTRTFEAVLEDPCEVRELP